MNYFKKRIIFITIFCLVNPMPVWALAARKANYFKFLAECQEKAEERDRQKREKLTSDLLSAVNDGREEEVVVLLLQGADPYVTDSNDDTLPGIAIKRRHLGILKILFAYSPDMSQRNKDKFNLLDIAKDANDPAINNFLKDLFSIIYYC